MPSKSRFFSVVLLAALSAPSVCAQVESGAQARPRVTQAIDEANRIALPGNTHPEAGPNNDRGAVAGDFPMDHMLLQLKRSPEQELALQQFLDELQAKSSPNFHRWLSAQEFGEQFGLAQPDLDAVAAWLASQGFRVNVVYPSGMLIDDTRTLSNFNNGVYLVWSLSGHVKINVMWVGGDNAVVSGVFFK